MARNELENNIEDFPTTTNGMATIDEIDYPQSDFVEFRKKFEAANETARLKAEAEAEEERRLAEEVSL